MAAETFSVRMAEPSFHARRARVIYKLRRWAVVALHVALVGLILWCCRPSLAQSPPAAPVIEPIYSNERLFSIPFFLNPAAQRPESIHLYVTGDGGQTWSHYQQRRPDQNKFDFRAGEDGSFGFLVRTDRALRPPVEGTKPEKIVIVDQQRPEIDLNVSQGPTGEVVARWVVTDPHLDPQTFRLVYRAGRNQPWLPVAMRPNPKADETELRGSESWTVAANIDKIDVSAEVFDRAGNQHYVTRVVSIAPPPLAETSPQPSSVAPVASNEKDPPPPSVTAPVTSSRRRESTADHTGWASRRATGQPPHTESSDEGLAPISNAQRDSAGSSLLWATDTPSPAPAQQPYQPPVSNRFDPVPPSVDDRKPVDTPPPAMTRSLKFNLDYELDGVQSNDVVRVELWVTEDGGSTWQPHGLDEDLRSPFEVNVLREGRFGYRLLVHDSYGDTTQPPQPGESPDLSVVVDRTQPKVRLTSAEFSRSEKNVVEIAWQASDEFLTKQPIQISYAPTADGPWSIIATELENSGSYLWNPTHRLPAKTYLRVDATDQAGNVGMDATTQPLAQPGKPRGIIRRVRPAGE